MCDLEADMCVRGQRSATDGLPALNPPPPLSRQKEECVRLLERDVGHMIGVDLPSYQW